MPRRRLLPGLALFAGLILHAGPGTAQEPATPPPPSSSTVPDNGRPVSWKLLVPNILHDQKPVWLFPVRAAQGKHAKPTLAFILATAGLVALDPHDAPYFRRTTSFHDFNRVFSGRNTALATAIVPLSAYAVGLAHRDSYAQQTALLAGEAVADAEILTLVMKNVDRRLRPAEIPPDGDFAHTWFKGSGRFLGGRGSFPSGHTIAAFSVATIFAERYRRHRWVPWVAYGLAGLVGFSRVPLQSHFPSDVFAGAVFGYSISRYVVLRQQ
ncbi:MAG: phosphatase PAP2 family protein [Acidobacteriia bacterium]|nr:phosphatase PAP2 family protein [Terriglobia bacterium]